MLTTERQQFEEWIKFHSDEEECTNLLQRNSAGTNYLHPHTDLAWIAWQASREVLAKREAQPVEWASTASLKRGDVREVWPNGEQHKAGKLCITALYTAPPAPAVPEEMTGGIAMSKYKVKKSNYVQWVKGFNACRSSMLAQPVSGGYKLADGWKLVPVEPTTEMINAALASGAISIRTAYSAMLAAAPGGGN